MGLFRPSVDAYVPLISTGNLSISSNYCKCKVLMSNLLFLCHKVFYERKMIDKFLKIVRTLHLSLHQKEKSAYADFSFYLLLLHFSLFTCRAGVAK